jgi:hypothetical protein
MAVDLFHKVSYYPEPRGTAATTGKHNMQCRYCSSVNRAIGTQRGRRVKRSRTTWKKAGLVEEDDDAVCKK